MYVLIVYIMHLHVLLKVMMFILDGGIKQEFQMMIKLKMKKVFILFLIVACKLDIDELITQFPNKYNSLIKNVLKIILDYIK